MPTEIMLADHSQWMPLATRMPLNSETSSRLSAFPGPKFGLETARCFPIDAASAPPGFYNESDSPHSRAYRVVDEPRIGSYAVVETSHVFDEANPVLASHLGSAERVLFIADSRAWSLYGCELERYFVAHDLAFHVFRLPRILNNELNKSLTNYQQIVKWLSEHRATTSDVLVAFGGGVTTDLVGFVAGTYRRGLDRINLPTTLIAMVDAALSPKTAMNIDGAKNAVGLVSAPRAIIVDAGFLHTLDPIHLLSGIAEIVKLAIVRSAELFEFLESQGASVIASSFQTETDRNMLSAACRLFLQMKWEAPFPGNRPASLRAFGHSFSRELESEAGLTIPHGLAVSVEMAVATALACQIGLLSEADRDRILSLIASLGLPTYCRECQLETIWPVFARRFERSQPFYFPIPDRIGHGTFLNWFSKPQLASAVNWCRRFSDNPRELE